MMSPKEPPDEHELTKEQTEKLVRHVRERWKNLKCPKCREQKWRVNQGIYLQVPSPMGNIVFSGKERAMPLGAIICTNCGHVDWVNLMRAGIVTKDDF